jgi:archaeal type IV pilus assembly protein PilA
MNTLRKMRKNAKALSPVVASIILIAVTVAVSIAVAAWMGALTIGFMGTEELKITSMTFTNNTAGTIDYIVVVAKNTGTTPVTLNGVTVNGVTPTVAATYSSTPPAPADTTGAVAANAQVTVTITYDWTSGSNYQVKLASAKGNSFPYTASAPS